MMATKAEVRSRAGEFLPITRIGQGLPSQDTTRLDAAYTEVYAELKDEGLAIWASTGTIPDKIAGDVAALMALNAADSYGVSQARYTRIVMRAGQAWQNIRAAVQPRYESMHEPSDY